MSLNPGGASNYGWNYSKQDKEGFSLELWGTIVSLQEVQAREYTMGSNQPGRPRTWPDGNPVMNIRVGLAMPDGSLKSITFGKAGKKQVSGEKPSLHMQLYRLTNGNMMELVGKTIHIWTWPAHPETGVAWGQGNPRLFGVEEVEGTKYELAGPLPPDFQVPELYANDAVHGGQPVPPSPQQMQQPNVMPMQGGYYAAPTAQQYPQPPQYQQYIPQQQAYAPQPAMAPAPQQVAPAPQAAPPMQQPMMPQGMGAPAPAPAMQAMPPQPASAPMPQGMDPAVAQAMQAVGAVNVQEVAPSVYDDDIPFNQAR